MKPLIRRAWYFIRQRRLDDDLAEEMDVHRAMAQREIENRGVDPREAAFAAQRAFGSRALAADRSRDIWVPRWLQGLGQDFRLAVRSLFAHRLVSAVAILSLALGIGANTAIFSLVDSLILRTLPVAEPQCLVTVSSGDAARPGTDQWTTGTWEQIRARAGGFGGAFAWSGDGLTVESAGPRRQVRAVWASGDAFSTLGVQALVGRTLTQVDDVATAPDFPAAVISDGFWHREFGASPVIGTRLVLNRVLFTIVGVAPPAFFGLEVGRSFDVALPLSAEPLTRAKGSALDVPSTRWLRVMLRLKPGQSLDAATTALRGMQPAIRAAAMPQGFPQIRADFLKQPFTLVPAATGISAVRRRYERPLLAIFIVVALVLLIGCTNLANLLLARASARRHELSIRLALGASRWRLARQFFVESLVLGGLGAVVGLVFAVWSSRALVSQLSNDYSTIRVVLDLPLDWRVLAFTMTVTITTVVLFGTAPAIGASRVDPVTDLKGKTHEAARFSVSSVGVVVQVALSLVLAVAAGLFVQTFDRLAQLPLGFDRDRVLLVNAGVSQAEVDPAHRDVFYQRLVDVVKNVPGVERAAASMMTPISGGSFAMFADVQGEPRRPNNERVALVNFVTPGWFTTYGTPLLEGRDLNERDTKRAVPIMVVNSAFTRRFFSAGNPIGRTVDVSLVGGAGVPAGSRFIVGVAGDAVYRELREDVQPTMYLPIAQWNIPFPLIPFVYLAVRPAAGMPTSLVPSVAAALTSVDRGLDLTLRPLSDQVNASFAQERLVAQVSGFFAALALLLAGLGLYGVTGYAVNRRRREIGIRMALGAAPGGVVRLVLSRVTMLIGLGVVIGATVSLWASRFVASLLYGLEPRDPATLIGAVVVLAAVGGLAAWLPARRASRVDPAIVLRYE